MDRKGHGKGRNRPGKSAPGEGKDRSAPVQFRSDVSQFMRRKRQGQGRAGLGGQG